MNLRMQTKNRAAHLVKGFLIKLIFINSYAVGADSSVNCSFSNLLVYFLQLESFKMTSTSTSDYKLQFKIFVRSKYDVIVKVFLLKRIFLKIVCTFSDVAKFNPVFNNQLKLKHRQHGGLSCFLNNFQIEKGVEIVNFTLIVKFLLRKLF